MELFGKYGSEFRKFKYNFQLHSIFFWNIRKPENSKIGDVISRSTLEKIGFDFESSELLNTPMYVEC